MEHQMKYHVFGPFRADGRRYWLVAHGYRYPTGWDGQVLGEDGNEVDERKTCFALWPYVVREIDGIPRAVPVGLWLPDKTIEPPKPGSVDWDSWPREWPVAAPRETAEEAADYGLTAFVFSGFEDVLDACQGLLEPLKPRQVQEAAEPTVRWEHVVGCSRAKRAIEIAAAGGHDCMLLGPPGVGKSLLAQAMQGILPPPDEAQAAELRSVWRAAGLKPPAGRPVVIATQNTTVQALVGGGTDSPYPGLASKAHSGVLVAEELLRWSRSVQNSLLTVMQEGKAVVSRAGWQKVWPAAFQLVATANPERKLWNRMSEALRDRIDLYAAVDRQPPEAYLTPTTEGETTEVVAARVRRAYERQQERGFRNGWLRPKHVPMVNLSPAAAQTLTTFASDGWSGRRVHQVLAVSRTIADLADCDTIQPEHVEEAALFAEPPEAAFAE